LLAHFHLKDDGTIRDLQLIVAGPSTQFFMVPVQANAAFLGLRFRAGWGGACLGVDAAAICNVTLDDSQVDILLGASTAPLRQALDLASLRAQLHTLARKLVTGAKPLVNQRVQEAIDLLHISGGRLPIAELARRAGMSERSLRRAMQQAVGLPVKTLGLILRFQRTVRLLRADPTGSLVAAAVEGGYSDQAHMTREFRRLGGFAPTNRSIMAHGDLPL
jgi:AraC-like DNA-binding protein